MSYSYANCSKLVLFDGWKVKRGQLKIQQMAFVLVILMIFFGLVSLFYFSVRISNLEGSVESLRDDEAREVVRKIASTPEFSFGDFDCAGCVDLDKILILSEQKEYDDFWDLDLLKVEKILGTDVECNRFNYPDCKSITILNSSKKFGSAISAFASLCYWDGDEKYKKCEIGRIYASGENING